jgi:isocitrate dehydrogenase
VGLAGSGNIGMKYSMFEAIHGSAPSMQRNKANPSGLLKGAIMMLAHIGKGTIAAKVENALLVTLEGEKLTADLASKSGKQTVGTAEFADEVIKNLGKKPTSLTPVSYPDFEFDNKGGEDYDNVSDFDKYFGSPKRDLVGVDMYIHLNGNNTMIGKAVSAVSTSKIAIKMVSSRGLTVFPSTSELVYTNDQWRCRFMRTSESDFLKQQDITDLIVALNKANLEIVKMETLYYFDGKLGFSLGQAE